MIDHHRRDGLSPDESTVECGWDGKPADYDHIMFVLGNARTLTQTPPA